MTSVRAIETRYAGCNFRSRLEARWAVFFDALGIPWEYEPEGFERQFYEDGPTVRWLPDFLLPNQNIWVEVKPNRAALQGKTFDAIVTLSDWGSGLPGMSNSDGTQHGGVLLLGGIPRTADLARPAHPILQHYKGVWRNYATFRYGRCVIQVNSDSRWASGDDYYDASIGGPYVPPEINDIGWRAGTGPGHETTHAPVAAAYNAARSARFEHGQSGAT